MQATTISIYSLTYRENRSYLFAFLFILGNLALPQICHLYPKGGHIFLPIYFFTLIGAYKYGWQVGLATALLSPLVNSLLFGMPPTTALPAILIKSQLLAFGAAYVGSRNKSVSLLSLLVVVLFYQIVGSCCESVLDGSLLSGFRDFRLGIPGMLIQVLGGYYFIKYLLRR